MKLYNYPPINISKEQIEDFDYYPYLGKIKIIVKGSPLNSKNITRFLDKKIKVAGRLCILKMFSLTKINDEDAQELWIVRCDDG